jgi:hypothetical protein
MRPSGRASSDAERYSLRALEARQAVLPRPLPDVLCGVRTWELLNFSLIQEELFSP